MYAVGRDPRRSRQTKYHIAREERLIGHFRGWCSKPREVGRHYEDGVVD